MTRTWVFTPSVALVLSAAVLLAAPVAAADPAQAPGAAEGAAAAGLRGELGSLVTQRRRLEDLRRQTEGARSRVLMLHEQTDDLVREREANAEQQKAIEKDLVDQQAKIRTIQEGIASAEEQLKEARDRLSGHVAAFQKRAQALYEMRDAPLVGFVVASADMGDFMRRVDAYKVLSEVDLKALSGLEALSAEVDARKRALAVQEGELEKAQAARKSRSQELLAAIKKDSEILDRLASERTLAEDRAQQLASASDALAATIRRAEEQRQAQVAARQRQGAPADPSEAMSNRTLRPGSLGWPIDGDMEVVRAFGTVRRPGEHEFFSPGIDIRIVGPTTVKAVESGRVIHRGRLPSLGNVLMIDHGGAVDKIISVYGNVDDIQVSIGQLVNRGDSVAVIGRGEGGGPVEARLHLEIRKNAAPQDPLNWLER